jgi:dCMP deaminase
MEDKEEWWNDRPEKLARVIHSEMNALLNSKESVTNMSLYCTHPCCEQCAKHIIASGITRVVFGSNESIRRRFDITKSMQMFADCGVEVLEIET